ncbi:MAG: hypothetical protein LBL71_00875 [Endomicrobium sp.]|jgi:hypothetical protein|nr:hypothetical protein [Endomicrobium sp.]
MAKIDDKIKEFVCKKSPEKEEWLDINDFLSLAKNSYDNENVLIYFSWVINNNHADSHNIIGVFIENNKLCNLPNNNEVFSSIYLSEDEHRCEHPFFIRNFKEWTEEERNKLQIEISQKITHILELYYVPHKNAYYTYDEDFNLVEVIRICINKEYTYITMKKKYLNLYLDGREKTLVKYLNCFRFSPSCSSSNWGKETQENRNGIRIKLQTININDAVHMKGYIICPKVIPLLNKKKYETFKIYDLRHKKRTE